MVGESLEASHCLPRRFGVDVLCTVTKSSDETKVVEIIVFVFCSDADIQKIKSYTIFFSCRIVG